MTKTLTFGLPSPPITWQKIAMLGIGLLAAALISFTADSCDGEDVEGTSPSDLSKRRAVAVSQDH